MEVDLFSGIQECRKKIFLSDKAIDIEFTRRTSNNFVTIEAPTTTAKISVFKKVVEKSSGAVYMVKFGYSNYQDPDDVVNQELRFYHYVRSIYFMIARGYVESITPNGCMRGLIMYDGGLDLDYQIKAKNRGFLNRMFLS